MSKVTISTDEVVELTQDRVKELFEYLPETGELKRKIKTGSRAKVGMIAGCKRADGYMPLFLDGRSMYVHRVVWLYHNGKLPEGEIDHINHDSSDNRIENLREVNHLDNLRNSKMHSHNTSGVTGLSWNKLRKKWEVYIQVNRKKINLGLYSDKKKAISARIKAMKKHGFHETHGAAA